MKSTISMAAAAATVVLTAGLVTPAVAAGHERSGDTGTHSRGAVSVKEPALSLIRVTDRTLVRISGSARVNSLGPENRSVVLDRIGADRVVLAKMRKVVRKTHKPATLEKVQKRLAQFHPQNYSDIAYLLDDSEVLLWVVAQCRTNLAADDSFSPEERASLNAGLGAVESRLQAVAGKLRGATSRSDQDEIGNLDDALVKAEEDLDEIDLTIYNGGDHPSTARVGAPA